MTQLHFCRDGVLRRTMTTRTKDCEDWVTSRIPVAAWEASIDKDVFLKSLHDAVILEEDLTVGELFANLEPWAHLMTGVACMDFPAFLDEMRRPTDTRTEDVSRIVLSYGASISPVPAFTQDETPREPGVFNMGRPARTGRLMLEEGWTMSAMVDPAHIDAYDGAESVSLSFTPLSEWQHLPILIKRQAHLQDETAWAHNAVYLGTEESLTKADHQNVTPIRARRGDVMRHEIAIDPPSPTFFDAIVRGFLWDVGFHYSPASRDASRDQVLGAMEELEAGTELDKPEATEDHEAAECAAEREILERALVKAREMGLAPAAGSGDE